MSQDDAFWANARKQITADPTKINLNAGTLFPTPIPIQQAVAQLRTMMVQNPSDFVWRQMPGLLDRSRAALAEYLNCEPIDLLLLPNVTYAINLVIASLKLPAGSEILTSDHEYGAMLYAWQRFAEENNLRLRQIELPHRSENPAEIIEAFERGISPATRVLFFSHMMTSTGLVVPAAEICEIARKKDILSIVDGAHAPGMIPVDLSRINADFYGANCHKWLMAPAGAGFLHVAPQRKSMLRSIITSWGWNYDPAKADEPSGNGGTRRQWDMEFHGTIDRCPQMVLPECLEFRKSLGGDESILKRCKSLSTYARRALAAVGLTCAVPENDLLNGGALTAFDLPCNDVIQMRDYFWNEHNIECPVTRAAGKTFLRVSTGWFNTTEEIDKLAKAVSLIPSPSGLH